MSQYDDMKSAFLCVVGGPVRERASDTSDTRSPARVCWLSRNIWLRPEDPNEHDVQLACWSGEAWTGQTIRSAGLWFGMSIEFKDIFSIVLPRMRSAEFVTEALKLGSFRVTLGEAFRSSAQFSPRRAGLPAAQTDYEEICKLISEIQGHRGLPRPHLQIYKQVGEWNALSNTRSALAERMSSAREQLAASLAALIG